MKTAAGQALVNYAPEWVLSLKLAFVDWDMIHDGRSLGTSAVNCQQPGP